MREQECEEGIKEGSREDKLFHMVHDIRKQAFRHLFKNEIDATDCCTVIFAILQNNGMGLDKCQGCWGLRGGTPGNENVQADGKILCDYCSSDLMEKP